MKYISVTVEELGHLREGLKVIESLDIGYGEHLEIYFYGLTDNASALDAVREAIVYWADEEINEADVQISEAVLLFPVSADILYYLTGSGLTIRDGEAVYISEQDGPRTVDLQKSGNHRLAAGQFKAMALARDEFGARDFLMQYGTKAQQPAPQEVPRTTSATGTQPVPEKKSSGLNLSAIESWLGS